MNTQVEEYKIKLNGQKDDMNAIIAQLEDQKQLNSKSPSNTMKSLCDKLKIQLSEKDRELKGLMKAVTDLRSDMVSVTKNNLMQTVDEQNQAKHMIDKKTGEFQVRLKH